MLLYLILTSIILMIGIAIYNKYLLQLPLTSNIIQCITFLIISIIFAFFVDYIWNPSPIRQPNKPKKSDKDDDTTQKSDTTSDINNCNNNNY